ncbi:MAG TPA: helix-turn-helix domain-containing protein [Solirubrobacterales bacterium]
MSAQDQDGRGNRELQDAVSYAVGHRIRVEILAALHDLESASAADLARIVHQPLSTVTHHVDELLKSGSIRVERTEKVRSVDQRFFRVVNPIFLSDEELAAMPEEEQEDVCRYILQSMTAEALAAFWAGKLTPDPRLFLVWSWFNVDEEGRGEIADEQLRSWKRIREVERKSAARCASSGEKPFSVMVSSFSFHRSRNALRPSGASEEM